MNFKVKFILSVAVLGATACGHNDWNYVYYTPAQPEAKKFNTVHQIKDIVGNADVDMLWIVDNSGSMTSYQQSVASNLGAFIDTLTKGTILRWKIGLISTSLGEMPYLGFDPGDELTYQDASAASRFKAAIAKLGTNGDATERTYEPVIRTLAGYPSFLRTKADLVLVLVSDAPEQSRMTTREFVTKLEGIKGNVSKLSFYGVLDPAPECPSTDDPFSWPGNKFDELLHMVKGAWYKICDPDYSVNLIDIANRIVRDAKASRIQLQTRPKIETLSVWYHGAQLPGGAKENGGFWVYSFNENAVVFHDLDFAPGDQEQVRVTYEEDLSTP